MMTTQRDTEQMNAVRKRLEQEDFALTVYEDVVVRQMVERITVVNKQTIRIQFVSGLEIVQNM